MSVYNKETPFKNSVNFLIDNIKELTDERIKPSHAHALISAAFGYKSKKAFVDDYDYEDGNYDSYDDYTSIWIRHVSRFCDCKLGFDEEKIQYSLATMKESPLKFISFNRLSDAIAYALIPECNECGCKTDRSSIIHNEDCEPSFIVCSDCAKDGYELCEYCDELYPEKYIKNGECLEHRGEGYMDEDTREDWNSYIENITKD